SAADARYSCDLHNALHARSGEQPMIRVVPIDFMGQGALIQPVDAKLHDMAVEYCARELKGGIVDFSKFSKIWVGMKDGEVLGIAGYVLRPDVPLFRSTDALVMREMGKRMNDFFADN